MSLRDGTRDEQNVQIKIGQVCPLIDEEKKMDRIREAKGKEKTPYKSEKEKTRMEKNVAEQKEEWYKGKLK